YSPSGLIAEKYSRAFDTFKLSRKRVGNEYPKFKLVTCIRNGLTFQKFELKSYVFSQSGFGIAPFGFSSGSHISFQMIGRLSYTREMSLFSFFRSEPPISAHPPNEPAITVSNEKFLYPAFNVIPNP